MRTITVRPGRAKPLWHGHPWVHAASVLRDEGDGDVARVMDADGRLIGRGLVSPASAIRVRLLDREEGGEAVDDVLRDRIDAAVALRRRLFPDPATTNTYRLVHSEGDGIPGLVVDRHADVLVAQLATGPMHRRREVLARHLLAATGARTLVARAGGYEREEGIDEADVPYHRGDPLGGPVDVVEAGLALRVDPLGGQKTGHYADQRENRLHVAALARGARVLDLFAGTGGFSLQALRHGAAEALAVEQSSAAAATARALGEQAGMGGRLEVREADVDATLAALKEAGARYDVVVCDPPSFFPRRGGSRHALRAHRELLVRSLTRVEDGGFLAAFACTARLPAARLAELLAAAGRECRRSLRVLRELHAGPDHPVLLAAPEGRYLSGLLVQVLA